MFKIAHINISAYRVLRILVLFMQHNTLSLSGLGQLLINDPLIAKVYTPETLLRYINTLQHMGCQFKRIYHQHQYQYQLQSYPFASQFSKAQMEGLWAFIQHLDATPLQQHLIKDNPWQVALQLFSKQLKYQCSIDNGTHNPTMDDVGLLQSNVITTIQTLLNNLALQSNNSSLLPTQPTLQVVLPMQCQQFKAYCQQGQLLQVQFKCKAISKIAPELQSTAVQGQLNTLTVAPWYVNDTDTEPKLYGYNWHTHTKIVLLISQIVSVKQLAQRCHSHVAVEDVNTPQQWVEFKLSGRLAKTYRPYPQEKCWLVNTEDKAWPQLMVRTPLPHPVAQEALIQRLLKYGQYCLLLEPYFIRTRLQQHIKLMTNPLGSCRC
jgi:hypothetical protein